MKLKRVFGENYPLFRVKNRELNGLSYARAMAFAQYLCPKCLLYSQVVNSALFWDFWLVVWKNAITDYAAMPDALTPDAFKGFAEYTTIETGHPLLSENNIKAFNQILKQIITEKKQGHGQKD